MIIALSSIAFILFCILLISAFKLIKIVKKTKLNSQKTYSLTEKRIYIALLIFSSSVFLIIFIILVFLNATKGG